MQNGNPGCIPSDTRTAAAAGGCGRGVGTCGAQRRATLCTEQACDGGSVLRIRTAESSEHPIVSAPAGMPDYLHDATAVELWRVGIEGYLETAGRDRDVPEFLDFVDQPVGIVRPVVLL